MTATTAYRIEGHKAAILGTIRAMLETQFKTRIDKHISDERFARGIESATIQRGAVAQLKTNRFAYLAYDEDTNTLMCYDELETPADVIDEIKAGSMKHWSRESFQSHSGGYSHITTRYIREYITDYARYDGIALWNWGTHITKTHGTMLDIERQAKRLGCEIDGDAWRAMLDSISFDSLATKTSDQICDELAYTLANVA